MSDMEIRLPVRNPWGHDRDRAIRKIEEALDRMKQPNGGTGCEVHDILSECAVLISLNVGNQCCAYQHNVKEHLQ